MSATLNAVEAVKRVPGLVPVVAHWPISHDAPPKLDDAVIIEQMPIAPYYKAFDVLVSAAGYNSFHEILAAGVPAVFVPQEDAGRDQQIQRAQFAADKGLAMICRRENMSALERQIAAARTAGPSVPAAIGWLDDWGLVLKAMGIAPKPYVPAAKARSLAKKPKALFKILHKHWLRENTSYENQFLIAVNIPQQTFEKEIKLRDLPARTIVITNSLDPIALRRAGLPYLWLNTAILGPHALRRQILNWFGIWRPGRIRVL
jgi:hypothetical protein